MKILILGCAGYIGSVVTKYLVGKGHEVIGIDNLLYGQTGVVDELNQLPGFTFVKGRLAAEYLRPESLDAVIHLAGYVGGPITERFVNESFRTNVSETIDSLRYYRTFPVRYIFVSTCSNYGIVDGLATEESPLTPLTPYAKHKVSIEKYIHESLAPAAFIPTTLRFATAFGTSPRTRIDLTINEFVYQLLSGKSVEIYGAEAWRPYCHVNDFAAALEMVINADEAVVKNQVFNVGSDGNNFTKTELIKEITDSLPGIAAKFKVRPGADLRDYKVSFEKFRREFGHEFISVADGVIEMAEAFRNGVQGWTNTPTEPGSIHQHVLPLGNRHKIPAR